MKRLDVGIRRAEKVSRSQAKLECLVKRLNVGACKMYETYDQFFPAKNRNFEICGARVISVSADHICSSTHCLQQAMRQTVSISVCH